MDERASNHEVIGEMVGMGNYRRRLVVVKVSQKWMAPVVGIVPMFGVVPVLDIVPVSGIVRVLDIAPVVGILPAQISGPERIAELLVVKGSCFWQYLLQRTLCYFEPELAHHRIASEVGKDRIDIEELGRTGNEELGIVVVVAARYYIEVAIAGSGIVAVVVGIGV